MMVSAGVVAKRLGTLALLLRAESLLARMNGDGQSA